MLLKIHKDRESRTHHLGALRGRWQPLWYTIFCVLRGRWLPLGKNKIMKDYTEADLYRR